MGAVNHSCSVREEELGPFLLGQLPPEQAEAVSQQVAQCPSCSAEVAKLAPVVAALAASGPPLAAEGQAHGEADSQTDLPPEGWNRVLTTMRREKRQGIRRRTLLGAAAAVVLGIGGVAAVRAADGDDHEPPGGSEGVEVTLAGVPGASASMVLAERRWGTAIDLEVSGLDPDETYGVWLERREGGRLSAGSFRPDGDGTFALSLSSALQLRDSGAVGVALLPGGRVSEAVDVLSAQLT